MYGHPQKPDPEYCDRCRGDDDDPSGFTIACLVIGLPLFFIAFTTGYFTGVWGWF